MPRGEHTRREKSRGVCHTCMGCVGQENRQRDWYHVPRGVARCPMAGHYRQTTPPDARQGPGQGLAASTPPRGRRGSVLGRKRVGLLPAQNMILLSGRTKNWCAFTSGLSICVLEVAILRDVCCQRVPAKTPQTLVGLLVFCVKCKMLVR